jgi:hypothetical protein
VRTLKNRDATAEILVHHLSRHTFPQQRSNERRSQCAHRYVEGDPTYRPCGRHGMCRQDVHGCEPRPCGCVSVGRRGNACSRRNGATGCVARDETGILGGYGRMVLARTGTAPSPYRRDVNSRSPIVVFSTSPTLWRIANPVPQRAGSSSIQEAGGRADYGGQVFGRATR